MSISKIIDGILAVEKGYVDHPADRGGPTNWGITQAVARDNGYMGDMRDLPESFARKVYEKRYITEPKFDLILAVDPRIGEELIDTGVNMGPVRAATFLQRWLNGFNRNHEHGEDLFVDGVIGPRTLTALRHFLAKRGTQGADVLYKALNAIQAYRYLEITEGNKTQRAFLFGWMANRVK
jgi:lysozyme family protein